MIREVVLKHAFYGNAEFWFEPIDKICIRTDSGSISFQGLAGVFAFSKVGQIQFGQHQQTLQRNTIQTRDHIKVLPEHLERFIPGGRWLPALIQLRQQAHHCLGGILQHHGSLFLVEVFDGRIRFLLEALVGHHAPVQQLRPIRRRQGGGAGFLQRHPRFLAFQIGHVPKFALGVEGRAPSSNDRKHRPCHNRDQPLLLGLVQFEQFLLDLTPLRFQPQLLGFEFFPDFIVLIAGLLIHPGDQPLLGEDLLPLLLQTGFFVGDFEAEGSQPLLLILFDFPQFANTLFHQLPVGCLLLLPALGQLADEALLLLRKKRSEPVLLGIQLGAVRLQGPSSSFQPCLLTG